MPTPSLLLRLSDARQYRAALADARVLVPALSDARQYRAALAVAPLPELGVGGVMVVAGRVPMLTASGTPPRYSPPNVATPWAVAGGTVHPVVLNAGCEVLPAEPAHYVPGALRPVAAQDTIRVTDALGVSRDAYVSFPDGMVPESQALEVAIGTDGVAALYSGGELALTASSGTGPYVWDIVTNRSGGTLTPEGAYVAGPAVGIDRVRVTDSLGEIGLAQLEVVAGQIGVNLTADPITEYFRFENYGVHCLPYALVWGEGGAAPYSIALQDNQTGAAIEPGKSLRVSAQLRDLDGADLDLTGWTFAATLYSQRGAVLADDLAVAAADGLLEVDLPDPSTLPLDPAVLRVTATTAGAVLALGYTTTAIEVLLVARPET